MLLADLDACGQDSLLARRIASATANDATPDNASSDQANGTSESAV